VKGAKKVAIKNNDAMLINLAQWFREDLLNIFVIVLDYSVIRAV
jgi:hypothetical protein